MTRDDARQVKAFVLSALSQPLGGGGFDPQSIPDDFDLRLEGVIDSLGFIQLLDRLRSQYGECADLADVPPELLTNVGVLCRHIAARLTTLHSRTASS